MNPIAPKAANDDIHDSSSVVILPVESGDSFDLKSSRLGPVNPITIPKMNAVKFTKNGLNESLVFRECNDLSTSYEQS